MSARFQLSGHSIQESTRGQNHDRSVSRLREILAHADVKAGEFAVQVDGIDAIRFEGVDGTLDETGDAVRRSPNLLDETRDT